MVISALDRKLLRDLNRLRGQVITIALVVACGIASYVTMRSTWTSLTDSRDTYYERYRFADVFAHLERAPAPLAASIEAIPGVARTYTRVVEAAMLPMEGMPEPAVGTLVSLPAGQPAPLNGVYLRSGRMIEPGRDDEALVIETFATAHGLTPGAHIPAVINGKLRQIEVVGIAMSPEYVFAMSLGDFAPDDKGVAILWMDRAVLAPAFQMEGAFNDVAIDVQPGADEAEVRRRLDLILEPYGGLGAVSRDKQVSNFMLNGELTQLQQFATAIPAIFLLVAAFLLNIVLSRLVHLQRTQIAALKALGYSDFDIGLHYIKLVSVIVVVGAAIGTALGYWFGTLMIDLYRLYFHFPDLRYQLDVGVIVIGVVISLLAALVGALMAVRRIASMPPAEAMRPPAPPTYHLGLLDRKGFGQVLGVSAMMIVRELRRRPLRTILSSLGIAASVGIVVMGRFSYDSFDFLMNDVFHQEQRGDLMVSFIEPVPEESVLPLRHVAGVFDVEGTRQVPVRIRSGAVWRDSSILGLAEPPRLRRVVDRDAHEVAVPSYGLGISRKLGEILGVVPGDQVEVELREGQRGVHTLTVESLIDDAFGLQGYMSQSTLHQVLGEEVAVNAVQLRVDPQRDVEIRRRLKEMPKVARVVRKQATIDRFYEQSGSMMATMTFILSAFAATIAIGVVYNNARVALSMRSRDLASLRVLGFTRGEISAVLLGELAVQVVLAIPFGLLLGTWWADAVMSSIDPETYRMPITISMETYAFAVSVAVGAGIASALLVRRKLDQLDLIGVLKTRE
ncbi:ABC transporter permease [Haliangium sp.]|uniref:ABC transporter permease n=1 Tax=Haliangium sp. TaxID=2663208 RepID=UPI003D097372